MTDTVTVASEAKERLSAVAGGSSVSDVYGGEWCSNGPAAFRSDLLAMLAAAPNAEPVSDVSNDLACDSAYLAGMATGWNFGQDNDADGYNNLKTHRINQMVEARKDLRAQPEAKKGEPVAYVDPNVLAGMKSGRYSDATIYPTCGLASNTALYTHPAPSSDVLEALERLVKDYESEGVTGPLMNCLRDLIAKHKGPQS